MFLEYKYHLEKADTDADYECFILGEKYEYVRFNLRELP